MKRQFRGVQLTNQKELFTGFRTLVLLLEFSYVLKKVSVVESIFGKNSTGDQDEDEEL